MAIDDALQTSIDTLSASVEESNRQAEKIIESNGALRDMIYTLREALNANSQELLELRQELAERRK